jgi:hypothetical protein
MADAHTMVGLHRTRLAVRFNVTMAFHNIYLGMSFRGMDYVAYSEMFLVLQLMPAHC